MIYISIHIEVYVYIYKYICTCIYIHGCAGCSYRGHPYMIHFIFTYLFYFIYIYMDVQDAHRGGICRIFSKVIVLVSVLCEAL